ncbi:hypothetical protein E4U03_07770 [Rothia nasimurium]|uniref:Uncharacterized protein n=1 Tax=Rothia nasimurium TaxID=85336 RepID=A0A4Y9F3L3_9MICC|nr:hypothetical protein [Rothia nasimurium]MBF0808505.1 hypothetical protein [Rothia nasimurium]TFU21899.1 hypothetical protein E4U03_07770 [Rothia nasimurium]
MSTRTVGPVTVGSATGVAAGTYAAILLVQFFALTRWLDETGVQALSGLLGIAGGILGGYLAPGHGNFPTIPLSPVGGEANGN